MSRLAHGDLVRLTENATDTYLDQSGHGTGRISQVEYVPGWHRVNWNNGNTNVYPERYLIVLTSLMLEPEMELDEIHAAQKLMEG